MKRSTRSKKSFTDLKIVLFVLFGLTTNLLSAQNCSINSGVPQTICENDVLTLYGQASGLFEANDTLVLWTQVSGPSVLIVSPNSLTTDVLGTVGGETYEFRISTICEDGSLIHQFVTNTILPISDAIAGADQDVCPGTGTLTANSPGVNETGIWSIMVPNHGITIDDVSSPTSGITIDGDEPGTTRLVWTITNSNGCSSADTVEITNLGGISPVDAGPDQALDNCYSTTHSTILGATQGGAGVNGQIGTWTIVGGPNVPIIDDVNDNATDVSDLIEGVYVFRWDVVGTCASGNDLVTITVPAPTSDVTDVGDTNADLIFCDARTEVVLNGTAPEFTNETVKWTQTAGPAGAVIANATNHIATVTGLDGASYYEFSYEITNNATACSSSALVTISYSAPPAIDIVPDDIVLDCGVSSVSIPYTLAGDGAESWQFMSTPPGIIPPAGETELNGNPQIINGLTASGTYVIRFRKLATVGSTCEAAFDDVVVTVSREASLSNAGSDQLLACNIYSTHLSGNQPISGLGTGIWSQIAGPAQATIDDVTSASSLVTFPANGFYKFRWIISNGALCDQNEDDVIIVVANLTPDTPDAGPDQVVCVNTPVYLDATPPVLNQWGYWEVIPANAGVTFSDSTKYNTTVYGLTTANTDYEFV